MVSLKKMPSTLNLYLRECGHRGGSRDPGRDFLSHEFHRLRARCFLSLKYQPRLAIITSTLQAGSWVVVSWMSWYQDILQQRGMYRKVIQMLRKWYGKVRVFFMKKTSWWNIFMYPWKIQVRWVVVISFKCFYLVVAACLWGCQIPRMHLWPPARQDICFEGSQI